VRTRTLRPSAIVAAIALALAASAGAQQPVETVPRAFSRSHAPGARVLPFGRTRCLVQYWHRGEGITHGTVTELGWRADELTRCGSLDQRVQIRIGNVARGFGNLSRTFNENFDRGATAFLTAKTLHLPAQTKTNDPNVPAMWIKGDRPFVFTGPHLLVEVDVSTEAKPRSTNYWADGLTMSKFDTLQSKSGPSCGGSLTADYDYGHGSLRLSLAGGEPNRLALFLVGTDVVTFAGHPLPLDLASLGMPGCWLGIAPLVILPTMMDAKARASLEFPIDLPEDSVAVHAQVVHERPTNAAGLVTSNVTHSVLGHAGLSNVLYNWDEFSPKAQFGPYASNRGTILLLRR